MLISAVIITQNEERNIRRCLTSLQDVVDDIVVIDSLSTDATEEICKEFNVKFVKQKWLGYSGQKNLGSDMAAHDWILSIDADEEVSDELKKTLLDLKKQDIPNDKVFKVNILPNYCGHWIRHCGWYPAPKVRLWNRQTGEWKGDIHEKVTFNKNVDYQLLKGDLNHYSYYSISDHIKKADRYSSLSAEEAFKQGKRCKSLWKLRFKVTWTFFHTYILEFGFLDGYYGYVVCKISAYATFFKYCKLHEMTKNIL